MINDFSLIAETAFSHEGEIEYLFAQIDAAKSGKADYIKFQILLDKDSIYTTNHPVYNVIDKWIFHKKQWLEALKYAYSKGLKVIALPSNVSSLEFCLINEKFIDAFEIHSVCFNEYYLLQKLNKTNKKVLLGIGGRIPSEIQFVMDNINVKKEQIILMYGFQSFPTDPAKINLNKIKEFINLFDFKMGYADHTDYDNSYFHQLNDLSFVLGARYFEKHIVLNKGEKRTDFESAIDYQGFIDMRNNLNKLIKVIGDGKINKLNDKEIAYKNREKQIVANKDIAKGKVITFEDLTYKNSHKIGNFEQKEIINIVGKKAVNSIMKDDVLLSSDLK